MKPTEAKNNDLCGGDDGRDRCRDCPDNLFPSERGRHLTSIIDDKADLAGKKQAQSYDFTVTDAYCRFIYFETMSVRTNPPWLDFVNEQLGDAPITFGATSQSPNGLLLISTENRLFAAVFGRSATSCLNRKMLEPDFGIKTAMNMCGNEEIRQTRSQSNTITPTHIDRQAARPSDSFVFGLSEAEDLRYISAHIKGNRNTTLQGRNNLTVKVIGDEKLRWENIIAQCQEFLERLAPATISHCSPIIAISSQRRTRMPRCSMRPWSPR